MLGTCSKNVTKSYLKKKKKKKKRKKTKNKTNKKRRRRRRRGEKKRGWMEVLVSICLDHLYFSLTAEALHDVSDAVKMFTFAGAHQVFS